MIYIVKTNNNLYAYYNYDENIGGYFFQDELDNVMQGKDFVLIDAQIPVKKVERYLVNYAIDKELEQNKKGRKTSLNAKNK